MTWGAFNKDELLYNVESRLRKSNSKFNVYFGERLKNFELFHKYEWIFNDRFSFSILYNYFHFEMIINPY